MAPKCVHAAVGASILNCNFIRIREELKKLVDAGIDFVHLDVMDGNFVDDITFGPSFVRNLILDFPEITFEVHMMVEHPMKFIEPMAMAGVSRYIFHYEVTKNSSPDYKYSVEEIIDSIRSSKMEVALAINPDTPVQVVEPFLCLVDSILIMTVRPGLGGQKFMANMMPKVQHLRSLKQSTMADIELDGGVSPDNTDICGKAGANRIVCGSALLRSTKKSEDILKMRRDLYSTID
ncbi:hypothetical protein DERP_004960 [Dermatophagoides pteronyssinus]|uniref:Ribulose-phosphate 3-epimerase n=1 Tax=Dermatophagoides pteronyssinus TaxID=6956 RepID=A0ABQ8JU26_DERPT|nr:hypothetical protein DERP_004960 [Dermatophagoides pteronyssinus]